MTTESVVRNRRRHAALLESSLSSFGEIGRACIRNDLGMRESVLRADDPIWMSEARSITSAGLAAPALRVLKTCAGEPSPSVVELLSTAARSEMLRSLWIEQQAIPFLDELTAANIRFAIVKGPAVARFYRRPESRLYSDIDVIVEPSRFHDVVRLARRVAFSNTTRDTQAWQWFDMLCREGVNFYGPLGANVDVHHRIPPWKFGEDVSAGAIIDGSDWFEFAERRRYRVASLEHSLVFSCLHILSDLWKSEHGANAWRDTAVLMDILGNRGAIDVLTDAGLSWYCPVLREVLKPIMGESFFSDVELPGRSRMMEARVSALGGGKGTVLSRHRVQWAARLPVFNGLAFLLGTLLPSRMFLQRNGLNYRTYWRQGFERSLAIFRGADFRDIE